MIPIVLTSEFFTFDNFNILIIFIFNYKILIGFHQTG